MSELDVLIQEYYSNKSFRDQYEKTTKQQNEEIKKYFEENKLNEYSNDDYVTKISYQNRISMNEDIAISIIKENIADYGNIIKIKEYIDYDALESAIYNGEISAGELEPAKVTKVIPTLTVKPVKKKLNETSENKFLRMSK